MEYWFSDCLTKWPQRALVILFPSDSAKPLPQHNLWDTPEYTAAVDFVLFVRLFTVL